MRVCTQGLCGRRFGCRLVHRLPGRLQASATSSAKVIALLRRLVLVQPHATRAV
jgi:hypothetical protein